MKQHSLVLRARTSMAQELPSTLEERICAFHRQIKSFTKVAIKKSVIVQTTGNEKRHLTIVLTVLGDGVVLPGFTIFKGKRQPDILRRGYLFEFKAPQKNDITRRVPSALRTLQEKPDMIVRSFEACGIIIGQACPEELLEGQMYPDSADEADDPFGEEETLCDVDCDL